MNPWERDWQASTAPWEKDWSAETNNAPEPDAYTKQAKADSNSQNFLAGIGGALSGIPLGVREIAGKTKPGEFDEWKGSMEGLWSTPMGAAGQIVGGALPAVPLVAMTGPAAIAGAAGIGAAQGLVQPTGEHGLGKQRLINTGVGGALGAGGQKLGNMAGSRASSVAQQEAANLAAKKSENAARDATMEIVKKHNVVIPPSQINPTPLNKAVEGFAGKINTQQDAAIRNQGNFTNRLVKADLGLAPDAHVLPETFVTVRKGASQKGYAPLREFGEMPADTGYAEKVLQMGKEYDRKTANGTVNTLRNPEVEELLKDAQQKSFDSNTLVDLVAGLRELGFANKAPTNAGKTRALGKVQLEFANALEDLAERRLADAGQHETLKNYRQARELIAKSFTAEKAYNPATGNFNGNKLGDMFKKGKPLSGGMKEVGRVAAAYPKAMQEVTSSMPGISPLDFTAGLIGVGAGAGPAGAAIPFARQMVRGGILSQPFQKALQPQKYTQDELAKLLAKHPELASQIGGLLGGIGAPLPARIP